MSTLRESLAFTPVELAFGTSGLRGLVRDITSLEAYVNARAFLRFCAGRGEVRRGGGVALAGDLRPSTTGLVAEMHGRGEILQAVARAVTDSDLDVHYLGAIPSPALALYGLRRRMPSVMVTGSHIPFDRNGIKFNTAHGEVRKSDEEPILEEVGIEREKEYGRLSAASIFDERGMLKAPQRRPLPSVLDAGRREYVRRYVDAFPTGILSGRRVLVWEHSAVGRDILVEILLSLGADVVRAGRSQDFVAVDTEAVSAATLDLVQGLLDAAGTIDAAVSTDGDSDRPLVMSVERGRARFHPGDLVGLVTADYLGARHVAVPISANDAVDRHLASRAVHVAKTRIGSPYVIAAMREVGWEANGGFLTASSLRIPRGGLLEPLPTRDAMLPILACLCASPGRPVAEPFSRLPPRYGRSTLLRDFPRERSAAILRMLAPPHGIEEARIGGGAMSVVGPGEEPREPRPDEQRRIVELTCLLRRHFDASDGFTPVAWMNWLDGVRVGFENDDIAHIRPSGNAPELRLYAVAGTQERADRIAERGAADNGILRGMERDAREVEA